MANNAQTFRYVVLGAGRQGTAAAYDLARFGEAAEIVLADADPEAAQQSAARINQLIGRPVATACRLDVTDHDALVAVMDGAAVTLSAVPYYYNLDITHAALEAGCHLCDLGGNTEVVLAQHRLDPQAVAAGVSIVPDCGMGPGLINTLGELAIGLLDEPREIILYDGGLPQNPQPPWNYQLTFHINGLTNEYDGKAIYLRDGKIAEVDTLTEVELVDIPALGTLEAFTSAGGLSTSPYLYEGQLERYENKILRYPGHCEWFNGFKTLGLFSLEPIQVGGVEVVPRDFYHALLEPKITASTIKDICVMQVRGVGVKDGQEATVIINLVDRFDEDTGFTAMERLTGWHCAIMMGFQARGAVRPGGLPMQKAVPAPTFMEEVRRRGIDFSVSWV
jgi:lysine 6-dehydrogenase